MAVEDPRLNKELNPSGRRTFPWAVAVPMFGDRNESFVGRILRRASFNGLTSDGVERFSERYRWLDRLVPRLSPPPLVSGATRIARQVWGRVVDFSWHTPPAMRRLMRKAYPQPGMGIGLTWPAGVRRPQTIAGTPAGDDAIGVGPRLPEPLWPSEDVRSGPLEEPRPADLFEPAATGWAEPAMAHYSGMPTSAGSIQVGAPVSGPALRRAADASGFAARLEQNLAMSPKHEPLAPQVSLPAVIQRMVAGEADVSPVRPARLVASPIPVTSTPPAQGRPALVFPQRAIGESWLGATESTIPILEPARLATSAAQRAERLPLFSVQSKLLQTLHREEPGLPVPAGVLGRSASDLAERVALNVAQIGASETANGIGLAGQTQELVQRYSPKIAVSPSQPGVLAGAAAPVRAQESPGTRQGVVIQRAPAIPSDLGLANLGQAATGDDLGRDVRDRMSDLLPAIEHKVPSANVSDLRSRLTSVEPASLAQQIGSRFESGLPAMMQGTLPAGVAGRLSQLEMPGMPLPQAPETSARGLSEQVERQIGGLGMPGVEQYASTIGGQAMETLSGVANAPGQAFPSLVFPSISPSGLAAGEGMYQPAESVGSSALGALPGALATPSALATQLIQSGAPAPPATGGGFGLEGAGPGPASQTGEQGSSASTGSSERSAAGDLEALARDVYIILKHRLAIERERELSRI